LALNDDELDSLNKGMLTASNIPRRKRFASKGPNDLEKARPIIATPQHRIQVLMRILVGTRTMRKAVKPQQKASWAQ
jgi:hypothetical protein